MNALKLIENAVEEASRQRVEDLIRDIAGNLTAETLASVIEDLDDMVGPASQDLQTFRQRMALQHEVLGGQ